MEQGERCLWKAGNSCRLSEKEPTASKTSRLVETMSFIYCCCRVKLAVHKESKECVAVKIIHVDGKNGLTPDCLKKEVNLSISDFTHLSFTITLLVLFFSPCRSVS